MMRRSLPHLIASALLALLVACGSGSAEPFGSQFPDGFKPGTPDASTGGGSPKPDGSAEPEAEDSHEDEEEGGHVEGKYTAEDPPSETFRDADVDGGRTGSGKLHLQMRITPGCAEQGGEIEVTLKTKPDVQVAFFTQFKEEPSGKMRVYEGRTNAAGLFVQTMPVRDDQMPLQYVIQGAAADDKGSDGGHSGQWFHVVAEKGGCK